MKHTDADVVNLALNDNQRALAVVDVDALLGVCIIDDDGAVIDLIFLDQHMGNY